MRKGDEKRQLLLDAAERLFGQQGYEKTGVQDILTATGLSKGGFYHHFASKDEVLTALCERRAERAAAHTAEALDAAQTPLARIDAVLHGFMPLRREEATFVALLPTVDRAEGRAIALTCQDALAEHFAPLLHAEIASAAAVEAVCPPVPDMEAVILHIVNRCWIVVAPVLFAAIRAGREDGRLALLQTLNKYRRAVEVLLDAPFGSIEIVRLEEWDEVAAIISRK